MIIKRVGGLFFFPLFAASVLSYASSSAWQSDGDLSSVQPQHRSTQTLRQLDVHSSTDASPFSPGSHNLALDLGQIFLMGDLTRFNDSIGAQLHYTYGVSEIFGFDTSIGYSGHSEGKYSLVSLLSGLRLNMSWYDKVIPYGIFGLGFYRPSYLDSTVAQSSASSSNGVVLPTPSIPSIAAILFGIHLGAGINLELSKSFFFGSSLTIHNMFGATKTLANGMPLALGGNYTTFLVNTGITF